ncbi:MAG: hypothetical protein ACTSWR_07575, partial [Candidatus Helarchaeota archaeon]
FNLILGIIIGVVIIGFFVFYILVFPYMKRHYEKQKKRRKGNKMLENEIVALVDEITKNKKNEGKETNK